MKFTKLFLAVLFYYFCFFLKDLETGRNAVETTADIKLTCIPITAYIKNSKTINKPTYGNAWM